MRQRNVLSDNEWEGWLQWMKTAFEEGEILDYWKDNIKPQKWFDPAFREFQTSSQICQLIPINGNKTLIWL